MYQDIYTGTNGVFFDKDKLVYKLSEYIINSGENLNYEIIENRTKVVIITGKNELEKDLPFWNHPVVFEVKRETTVAIDLRPYMKSKLDDIITVREHLQDKYNGTLQLYRLVFTKLILDNELHWLVYVRQQLAEALASIVSTSIALILYDRSINDIVKIVSKLQLFSLTIFDKDLEDVKLDEIVSKLPRDDLKELVKGDLQELYAKLQFKYGSGELVLPTTTIGSLVTNIQALVPNDRAKGLTPDILLQPLSRGFYSLNSKELALGMLEDLPTLISVLVMVIKEGINAKSNFRKIIDSNKRNINPKELSKQLIDTYQREIAEI